MYISNFIWYRIYVNISYIIQHPMYLFCAISNYIVVYFFNNNFFILWLTNKLFKLTNLNKLSLVYFLVFGGYSLMVEH